MITKSVRASAIILLVGFLSLSVGPILADSAVSPLGANSGGNSNDSSDHKISLADGIYSKTQAKSGKKFYKKHCISCHESGYFESVLLTWQGEPLADLFEVMSAAMPESAPGSLMPEVYTDIFAYILKEAGYPASNENLDPKSGTFEKIIIKPSH